MFQKKSLLKFLPFVFIYLLLSCHSKSYVKIPSGVLSPDSMMAVLADAHVIQAAALQGYSQSPNDTTLKQAYEDLYKKHHITDSIYNESMRFYCDHARLLDSIYEKVLNNLNQQKVELIGQKPAQGK